MNWTVNRIDRASCHPWQMDETSLHHESRRYFSVVFVHDGAQEHLMLHQPEIGILGFVVAGQGPGRRWLMQAKAEPGNVDYVQWAPTVQATKSNYERVHGGRPTRFLELFTAPGALSYDILGSEQGDRFLHKFNRNCKRLIPEKFGIGEEPGPFAWFSNVELKTRLRQNYMVNTDARSVIASGSWDLLADVPQRIFLDRDLPSDIATALNRSYRNGPSQRVPEALRLLADVHRHHPTHFRTMSLRELNEHTLSADGVYDSMGRRALGYYDCRMEDREVPHWQQPLIERDLVGQYLLLFRVHEGVALFYAAACPEIGHFGRVEFGASLQSGGTIFKQDPDALSQVLDRAETILEIQQSDEGGRFYRNIGHYRVVRWHESPGAMDAANGCWLTLADLEALSGQKGLLSNELRTLLSLLLSAA